MAELIKEYTSVEEFTPEFDKAVATGNRFIVYLTGAISECDMATGKCSSWCPDCDVARPDIMATLEKNTKHAVLKGEVQTKEEWVGVATHPFKVHPLIKAGGVPSLILFEGQNCLHRVENLDDFKNEGLMGMFLEE